MKSRLLLLVVLAGFLLRIFLINWDQGYHLHPDERALILAALNIHFFNSLNPHFFNYGTLPLYILTGIAQFSDAIFHTSFNTYENLLYVGRILSSIADSVTIFLIYAIAHQLFSKSKIALAAAICYAIAFFPIQNSHFFVVDVFVTFFMTFVIFCALNYVKKHSMRYLILMGLGIGFGLGTKATAVLFLIPALVLPILVGKKDIRKILISYFVLGIATAIAFFFSMPYALLDHKEFIQAITLQTAMNNNAYIFPYTLQYVYTLPYWYYVKNVFLWGLGPFISILSLVGMFRLLINIRLGGTTERDSRQLASWREGTVGTESRRIYMLGIFILFYLFYFLIIGHSAVKFMRYMLPMYPFFAVFAGYGLVWMVTHKMFRIVGIVLITGSIIWTMLFYGIYSKPNTRIIATNWISSHIPTHSNVLVEHWDDRLPLSGADEFNISELTLYDIPDNEEKWQDLDLKLFNADYIIIASNRLYVPLRKLKDCNRYVKCYPKTSDYYDRLFDNTPIETPYGLVRFQKIAQFDSNPRISFGGIALELSDQSADESFTVYDHPKIMIFKKK